jgi:hypothetical protein
MITLVLLGIAICLFSIALLINPEYCFEFARKHFYSTKFQYGVGFLSLLLAVAIFIASPASKFPLIFEIVALFTAAGGLVCFLLSESDFSEIVSWEINLVSPYGRPLGACYALVGGLVIYAAT